MYNGLESALALGVTLFINVAVVVVAAAAVRSPLVDDELRQALLQRPLQSAPALLRAVMGRWATSAFGLALLASGLSSTITGTWPGRMTARSGTRVG